ncbi:hypothetical protein ZTR_09243 [Talaromyces verruculosus]|nr:hypothetical protein ZTR_09243 [Talaromyces verruculosus]
MTMNEQIPVDQAFYREFITQSDTESCESTLPQDETLSCENAGMIVKPDCLDQGARVSSRSLREVTKHDYAYQAYKEVMDAATATATPCKSRRRKTGLGKRARDSTDLASMVDEFSQNVRRRGQALTDEIRELREEVETLNELNSYLQEKIATANGEKDRLQEELIMSNHEKDRLREESAISNLQKDEKIRDLQRIVDERANFTYLVCQECGEARKYWRVFGCGHVFCTGCARNAAAQPLIIFPFGYPGKSISPAYLAADGAA